MGSVCNLNLFCVYFFYQEMKKEIELLGVIRVFYFVDYVVMEKEGFGNENGE